MIFIAILFALSVAVNAASIRLLFRASRRLLQYDDIFQNILPVLEEYDQDLVEMTSADLDGILADHPEVRAFHVRNMAARRAIESIVDSVTKLAPERKEALALPRPDME